MNTLGVHLVPGCNETVLVKDNCLAELKETAPAPLDLASLVEQLQKSPELASALAVLIAAQVPTSGH